MIHAFTVEQVRAAERIALDATGPGVLMRQAAGAVASTVVRELQDREVSLSTARVLLLVGPGNNGGDALYAGAVLSRRGIRVLAVAALPDRVHQEGWEAFLAAGGRAARASDVTALMDEADAIVDGLVGIGSRLPLGGAMGALVDVARRRQLRLAIDVPSGIDPDSGAVSGPAFTADVTVTFGGMKPGLLVSPRSGRVDVVDLGIEPIGAGPVGALSDDDADELLRDPEPESDKFSGGVVGIVAGSTMYPGAAVLSVGGAVRLRPGLVRYAGPQAAEVVRRWPEVVTVAEPGDAGRVQAWVVGPGMGTDDEAVERLRTVLAAPVPVLIDADGLTLLARHPDLIEDRPHPTVLTPHHGEFARLFPDLSLDDRLAAVQEAAARTKAIVLLKGRRTLVAAPFDRVLVNLTGTSWLATAGSGDVLSGVIGSLLAIGADPVLAVAAGAHLHGRAGERAAADRAAGAQELWSRLR